MSSKFPPGLLNPGLSAPAKGFCERFLRVECPSGREFVFNLLFSSYGVWLLLPLSVLLLLVYRLVGPPEVDEREEELRQQWADHRQRFKSGAKRSTLRGVIKSSYLTELSETGGRDPRSGSTGGNVASSSSARSSSRARGKGGPRRAASHGGSYLSHGGGGGGDDDDDSWEDVRRSSSEDASAAAVAAGADADADAAAATPRLPPPRETVRLLTTPGPTRVTIVGDRGGTAAAAAAAASAGGPAAVGAGGTMPRLSVLTLHAAGHNHRTCLGALEREVARDEELGGGGGGGRGVVFYHVDTPGHEEEATGIEAKALSLEAQAAQLLEVTIQLGLSWFVGLGVGSGANVLLRFACDNPDRVAGLILANGSAEVAGRRERNTWLAPRFRLSWESDMKAAREALVPLSFPSNSSLGNRYRAGLGTMHSGNVLKYVDASLCRDDVPVSRLKALNDVWVLLLCGTEPPGSASSAAGFLTGLVAGVDAEEASRTLLDRLRRAAGAGQASKATLVKLDGGGVGGGLVEARPREVLAAMKLFLNKCF